LEKAEISIHQWKIYDCLTRAQAWMTNKEVAEQTGVSLRRTSFHTNNLVQLGILDQAEVYPGHRFRISSRADKRNTGYLKRLQQAGEIFGVQTR
jgi:DNA-binding IclR family transcriptional regulator